MMMLAGRSGQRGLISLPMRAVPTDTIDDDTMDDDDTMRLGYTMKVTRWKLHFEVR